VRRVRKNSVAGPVVSMKLHGVGKLTLHMSVTRQPAPPGWSHNAGPELMRTSQSWRAGGEV
jgi:hypothetical protein